MKQKRVKKKHVEEQLANLGTQLATLGEQSANLKTLQNWIPYLLGAMVGAIITALTYVCIQRQINMVEKKITLVGNEITLLEERKNALYGRIDPLESSTNDMIRVLYG